MAEYFVDTTIIEKLSPIEIVLKGDCVNKINQIENSKKKMDFFLIFLFNNNIFISFVNII